VLAEWTGYARDGRPTVTGAPRWPAVTPRSPLVMSLQPAGDGAPVRASTLLAQHNCGFWARVSAQLAG
jgi:para-nitrobenzyl esterase